MWSGLVNRLERLYAISEVIRGSGRQPISSARLAERFEVSRRTIERDLAALRQAGAPLTSEGGRNGGIVSLDTAAGAVVALSATQVTAILTAIAGAGSAMPYAADAAAAADVLLNGLATNTRASVDELRCRLRTHGGDQVVSPRVLRSLEEAVRRQLIVSIDYVDASGDRTSRPVEAVGFFRGPDGWFLNGWCHMRQGGRIFRLDRIERASLTTKPNQVRDVDEVLGWIPVDAQAP